MKYYWYQLLYALRIKKRPDPFTSSEIITIALAKISGADPSKVASEIERQRGVDALNAMTKEWSKI